MASHVSQCMEKACMCDTWQAMCVTHGMPCVNMHDSFEAYIRGVTWAVGEARRAHDQSVGVARRREREGRRRRRKGEEKGRKGKEKEGKERRRKEENRIRKRRNRGKRKRKRKECCAVSRPGWKKTRNCATRGRFPHTLVILRLGAV